MRSCNSTRLGSGQKADSCRCQVAANGLRAISTRHRASCVQQSRVQGLQTAPEIAEELPRRARSAMKRLFGQVAAVFIGMASGVAFAHDVSPDVVVSIKPIHSLVAGVMGDTGSPKLLLEGAASPHTYQMRFSDAQALSNADVVFWIGGNLETFLERPIQNLSADSLVVTLEDASGIHLLRNREGGIWSNGDEADGHEDEHGHDDESGHDAREEDDHEDDHHEGEDDHADEHDHDAKEEDDHEDDHHESEDGDDHEGEDGHTDEHGHDHGEYDLHLWLDPDNAIRFVGIVADTLSRVDPSHAESYMANANEMRSKMTEAVAAMESRLASVRDRRFIVFHDGYQYFEEYFSLASAGSVVVDPSRPPGARRISELRQALAEHGVICVFTEPQFEPDLVQTIISGTGVKTAALDPLGAEIEAGPDAWFEIMNGLADSIAGCLAD